MRQKEKSLAELYQEALASAISEFRALAVELEAKERRFRVVLFAIISLSERLDLVVPPGVLAAGLTTRQDVKRAVQRARVAVSEKGSPNV